MALPHLDAAYNLARWLAGDASEAEDAVQEAYLSAYRYFESYQERDMRRWLLAIARNCFSTWRERVGGDGSATLPNCRRKTAARARAITPAEIERDIASDLDEAGMVINWNNVSIELPKFKADLHMRVDRDVLDWFKRQGKGYHANRPVN